MAYLFNFNCPIGSARSIVALGCAWLVGCSALQIDVDVYKGPLVNDLGIQMRQYGYLTKASRPLIDQMLNDALGEVGTPAKGPTKIKQCLQRGADPSAKNYMVDACNYMTELEKELKKVEDRTTVFETYLDKNHKLEDLPKSEAFQSLNEAVVRFATRVNFVMSQIKLYPGELKTFSDQADVLQALSNILLVHANDVSRQVSRNRDQVTKASTEAAAIRAAAQVAPGEVYDRIISVLTGANTASPSSAPGVSGTAAAATVVVAEQARLQQMETELQAAINGQSTFSNAIKGLAASLIFLGEPPLAPAADLMPVMSPEDIAVAHKDRATIVSILAAKASADEAPAQSLQRAINWLELEAGATRSVGPQRAALMDQARAYLSLPDQRTRFFAVLPPPSPAAAASGGPTPAAAASAPVLQAIRVVLQSDYALARQQARRLQAEVTRLDAEKKKLQRQVESMVAAAAAQKIAADAMLTKASESSRVRALLESGRPAVMAQAEAAKVGDHGGVVALLKSYLASLQPGADGKPAAADLALARKVVADYRVTSVSLCPNSSVDRNDCGGVAKTQLEEIDKLISRLRAQRVQALAGGDIKASGNLLEAMNAAYEQRASMIYLRPAGDYLRSVHLASGLQDGADPQYRNMLSDWFKYLLPDGQKEDARRKAELDKFSWQNINRVTLGGGGFTNYVLAKDDVGNWYVKAYSSDPEAILKSATGLAMFNAGSKVNVNLLQRYELQSRIDALPPGEEKRSLLVLRDEMTSQDGRPLLAMGKRYADQYGQATRLSVIRLHEILSKAPNEAKLAVGATSNPPESCKVDTAKDAIATLGTNSLREAAGQLEHLIDIQGDQPSDLVAKRERALQNGLTALKIFSDRAYRDLSGWLSTDCSETWRMPTAKSARERLRIPLLEVARERRTQIERYEDALNNIAGVASQK